MGKRNNAKLDVARKVVNGSKASEVKVENKPAAATKRPYIGCEWSRGQLMCRTGGSGPGSSHAITFEKAGGVDQAVAAAPRLGEEADAQVEGAR